MRSTGDYYLASDIMQESSTRYLERYGKNSESAALLDTIGRNLIYDNARKQKRNAQLQSDQNNPIDDPECYLMVREQYRQVLSAMQTLKTDERDILALAPGMENQDAAQICSMIQNKAQTINSTAHNRLAFETLKTARDMARLSVASQAVADVLIQALQNDYRAEEMKSMRASFMKHSRTGFPQNFAKSFSRAIQQGKSIDGPDGPGGMDHSGDLGGSGDTGGSRGSGVRWGIEWLRRGVR